MDVATLCAEVEAHRLHVAFLAACDEEYASDESQSEEEEEEEDGNVVHGLGVRWFDVFTSHIPRNQNAFVPIDSENFAMLLIRQTLHRCAQEHVTEEQARTMLMTTWNTCESEKGYMQPYLYKRIIWAAVHALDLIFVFSKK